MLPITVSKLQERVYSKKFFINVYPTIIFPKGTTPHRNGNGITDI